MNTILNSTKFSTQGLDVTTISADPQPLQSLIGANLGHTQIDEERVDETKLEDLRKQKQLSQLDAARGVKSNQTVIDL